MNRRDLELSRGERSRGVRAMLLVLTVAWMMILPGVASGQGIAYGKPSVAVDAAGVTRLAFEIVASPGAVKSTGAVACTPTLAGNGDTLLLPPVVVEGRRERLSREREERSGKLHRAAGVTYLLAGKKLLYEATVAPGEWPRGASLAVNETIQDCGCDLPGTRKVRFSDISELDALNALREQEFLAREDTARAPDGIAPAVERLAARMEKQYPFVSAVRSASDRSLVEGRSTREELEACIEKYRDGVMKVHFALRSSRLDPSFGNNAIVLERVLAAIREALAAPEHPRVTIVVAGFASPDGRLDFNEHVAAARAIATRDYLVARSPLTINDVSVYNAGIDWHGLRALVAASTLPEKYTLLRVIDTYPVGDGKTSTSRLATLRSINGGDTYQLLLREYFPALRSAAFIRVFLNYEL